MEETVTLDGKEHRVYKFTKLRKKGSSMYKGVRLKGKDRWYAIMSAAVAWKAQKEEGLTFDEWTQGLILLAILHESPHRE